MIGTLIDRICRLFSALMALALALMVVMVFANVVLRYGFNGGITASEELSRWLFVWMTFLGAVVALRRRAHLGTDVLVSRLPVAGRRLCLGATHLLMLFLCWTMLRGAWAQAVINAGTTSAVLQVPMAWLYASGVTFAGLATIVVAHEFWRLVTGQLQDSELIGVVESEDGPAPVAAVGPGRH